MSHNILKNKSAKIKIVYSICVFITLFFILDRITYLTLRNISNKFYNRTYQLSPDLDLGKKAVGFYNTLIFGSSRTRRAIHPFYLKKYLGINAYKVASPGKYSKYNYTFYSVFKKKYGIPKYIFYGIDYFIFGKRSNPLQMKQILKATEEKTKSYLKDDLNIFNPVSPLSFTLKMKEKIDTFFSDLIEEIGKQNRGKKMEPLISEYIGNKRTVRQHSLREPGKWKKYKYKKFPGPEGKYFKMLLDELEKDKVKLFIIILPEFLSTYRTNYQQDLFVEEIRSICNNYQNIVFINYNSPKIFNLSNWQLFRDGGYGNGNSHLNYYGAEILNKMLSEDIKKIETELPVNW